MFLLPEPPEEHLQPGSFVHEDAHVALGFGQLQRVREAGQGLLFLVESRLGLQKPQFDNMPPAFLPRGAFQKRHQARTRLCWPVLCKEQADECHLLPFPPCCSATSPVPKEFPGPAGGMRPLSLYQPELHLDHYGVEGRDEGKELCAVQSPLDVFSTLEGRPGCLRVPA